MPSNKPGSRLIRAAGGVAWRTGPDNEPEVLLVHRKKYDDWSLPKGKVEPGETLPVTAVREVMEEGGARLALGRRLASVRYSVGGRPKRVHYWVARVLSVDARAVPNHEVDEVTWLPADRAVEKVSYRHDHGVLAEFAARPPETVPLILLRHAKALPKQGWKRADDVRPLDDTGRSDAKSLVDLLTCFAPRPRLASSTAIRCLETLLPLAELTGETVRPVPSLYVHHTPAEPGDPEAELAAVVREAIASGQPTILCAHRENIPALRRAALALLADPSADMPADLPPDWDSPLPPGGFWVLNIAPLPASSPPAPLPDATAAPDEDVQPEPAEVPDEQAGSLGSSMIQRRSGWWRRARSRPASRAPVPGSVLAAAADRAPAGADPDIARGPFGILVSADRYDLTD